MKYLENKNDIKVLVDSFYNKIRQDALLYPVFESKIKEEQWPEHLEKMYSFWNSVLFSVADYSGNPFPKHMELPVDKSHFKQWVTLFNETLDEYFEGPVADAAKSKAEAMALLFMSKIDRFRDNDTTFVA